MAENLRPSFQELKERVDNIVNEIIANRGAEVGQVQVDNLAKKKRPNYRNHFNGFKIVKRGIEAICESNYKNPLSVREITSTIESTLFGKTSMQYISSWMHIDNKPDNVMYILCPELSDLDTQFINVNFQCRMNLMKETSFHREILMHMLCISNPEFLFHEFRTTHMAKQQLTSPVISLSEVYSIDDNPLSTGNFESSPSEIVNRESIVMSLSDISSQRIPHPLSNPDYMQLCDHYYKLVSDSPIVSLDIEGINRPSRIAVIHENGEVLFDSFIIDKETPVRTTQYFSGRFSEDFDIDKMNKALYLQEVIQILKVIVGPDTIILGHSLNGDFHSLKIRHCYVSDTAMLFNTTGNRHKKDSLLSLSEDYLSGLFTPTHYPADDAKATLALAKIVLSEGLGFGNDFLTRTGRGIQSLGTSVVITSEQTQEKFVNEWPEQAGNILFKCAETEEQILHTLSIIPRPVVSFIDISEYMESPSKLIETLWAESAENTLIMLLVPAIEEEDKLMIAYKYTEAGVPYACRSSCGCLAYSALPSHANDSSDG